MIGHVALRRAMLTVGLAAAFVGARPARADTLAEVRRRGELVCATAMDLAPFDFRQGGDYAGYDRDLIDAVGKDLGVKVKCLDLPRTSLLSGLDAGQFDLVIAPIMVTGERMRRFAFTVPVADPTVAPMQHANGKPAYFAWAGRLGPDDRALIDAISAALVKLNEDGRMAAIQTKWFGRSFALPKSAIQPSM